MKITKYLGVIFLAPLLSCATNNIVPNPSGSVNPAISPSPNVIVTSSPTPEATSTPSPDVALPEPTEHITVTGAVFDAEGKPIEGAEVTIKPLDELPPKFASWKGDKQITASNGAYAFRSVPNRSRLEIAASKTGYTTKTRSTTKLYLEGEPTNFNFGGENINDKSFALEKLNN